MQNLAEAAHSRLMIDIDRIRTDGGTQSRSCIDSATVETYTDAYREGIVMPPIDVFYDGEDYWLADGFHRLTACREAKLHQVEVIIHQGTRRDAVLYACGANANHGLRRTREDKRRAIRTLLLDPEWSQWSDRAIAKACRVFHETVGSVRRELAGGIASRGHPGDASSPPSENRPVAQRRIGLDGREIDVSGLQARSNANVAEAKREGEGRGVPHLVEIEDPRPIDVEGEAAEDEEPLNATEQPPSALPNQERARFDAYWTPDAHALAAVHWLCETLQLPDTFEAVEPAVGGGAWVRALHAVRPNATVSRFDIDSQVPGLQGSRRTGGAGGTRPGEMYVVADWLMWKPNRCSRRSNWDLCIGNRPYAGNLARWVEVSLERAPIVAFLERETITGTTERLPWWLAHRPTHIVKFVPRPLWQGPGARKTQDFSDSVLIVWQRGVTEQTRFDWLDVNTVVA